MYTARLDYDETAFRGVTFASVFFLRQPDGSLYPGPAAAGKGEIPDIEAVRIDPVEGGIWYASEGDRRRGMQPFVRHADADGRFRAALPLPEQLRMWPEREYGVRNNLSFEGISFTPDGAALWVAMEAPLYQDGPVPGAKAGALARLSRFERGGRMLGQYAYPVDAIPHAPAPGKLADNGVSDVLAIDMHRLYVLERSGAQDAADAFHYHCRLYEIDVADASDIQAIPSLLEAKHVVPVRKRLVLDFDTLPLPRVGNFEGMAWGRKLRNGHDTLVLVTDDNFNRNELGQLLVFEVVPR
jgi:hypothetical protein